MQSCLERRESAKPTSSFRSAIWLNDWLQIDDPPIESVIKCERSNVETFLLWLTCRLKSQTYRSRSTANAPSVLIFSPSLRRWLNVALPRSRPTMNTGRSRSGGQPRACHRQPPHPDLSPALRRLGRGVATSGNPSFSPTSTETASRPPWPCARHWAPVSIIERPTRPRFCGFAGPQSIQAL